MQFGARYFLGEPVFEKARAEVREKGAEAEALNAAPPLPPPDDSKPAATDAGGAEDSKADVVADGDDSSKGAEYGRNREAFQLDYDRMCWDVPPDGTSEDGLLSDLAWSLVADLQKKRGVKDVTNRQKQPTLLALSYDAAGALVKLAENELSEIWAAKSAPNSEVPFEGEDTSSRLAELKCALEARFVTRQSLQLPVPQMPSDKNIKSFMVKMQNAVAFPGKSSAAGSAAKKDGVAAGSGKDAVAKGMRLPLLMRARSCEARPRIDVF